MTRRRTEVRHDLEGEAAVDTRPRTSHPRRFRVVFHNDDYTTMEFVVRILMEIFRKQEGEATQIMLQIHHLGYATVGVFTRDVAETKAAHAMECAKREGYPLKCTTEPDEHDSGEDSP